MSLLTLQLEGHLFDTKAFNNVIDICEKFKIQFRVIDWDIGNYTSAPSKVSLQMMAKDKQGLNECMDEIEAIAEKANLEIMQGDDTKNAYDNEGKFLATPEKKKD